MPVNGELWGLFAGSFLAATLLPGGSELLFGALVLAGHESPWLLLAVATLGNTLGGFSSWLLGYGLAVRYPQRTLDGHGHARALAQVRRWGAAVLLLSWVPLIGDPLCVAAGWLRIGWLASLACIALGKGGRYALLLAALGGG